MFVAPGLHRDAHQCVLVAARRALAAQAHPCTARCAANRLLAVPALLYAINNYLKFSMQVGQWRSKLRE